MGDEGRLARGVEPVNQSRDHSRPVFREKKSAPKSQNFTSDGVQIRMLRGDLSRLSTQPPPLPPTPLGSAKSDFLSIRLYRNALSWRCILLLMSSACLRQVIRSVLINGEFKITKFATRITGLLIGSGETEKTVEKNSRPKI